MILYNSLCDCYSDAAVSDLLIVCVTGSLTAWERTSRKPASPSTHCTTSTSGRSRCSRSPSLSVSLGFELIPVASSRSAHTNPNTLVQLDFSVVVRSCVSKSSLLTWTWCVFQWGSWWSCMVKVEAAALLNRRRARPGRRWRERTDTSLPSRSLSKSLMLVDMANKVWRMYECGVAFLFLWNCDKLQGCF